MIQQQQRERLRWKRKPFPELVRLAWPIAVSMLSFSVMTLVDTLFVGRLGASALAAVGLGGVAAFTVSCFGFGAMRAEKILVAQALGAGDSRIIGRYLNASLILAVGLGLVAALVGQLVAFYVPHLAITNQSGRWAASYVSIRTVAAPIVLVTSALREGRHGLGDSSGPMRAALFGNLANLPMNALFIFVFGWGVAGAAWATVFAQMAELSWLLLARRGSEWRRAGWAIGDVATIWRLGAPLGLERLLDAGAFTAMVAVFARMGDGDLAAHQVGLQLLHFSFLPVLAIGEATCVLIGQAVGARELRAMVRVQVAALGLATMYVAVCGVLFFVGGSGLASLFTAQSGVVNKVTEILRVAAIFLMAFPAYQVGQASLRGVGDVRAAAWITILAAWGCTPLLAIYFGIELGFGVVGGWLGLGVEIALGSLALWFRWASHAWLPAVRRFHDVRRAEERDAVLAAQPAIG